MTLPATGPLALSQVAAELGVTPTDLNFGNAKVRLLAGAPTGPVAMSALLGKTGSFSGACAFTQVQQFIYVVLSFNTQFFGNLLNFFQYRSNVSGQVQISGPISSPNWTGSLKLTNVTTGVSAIIPYAGIGLWELNSPPANLIRTGSVDTFTIFSD